MQLEIFYLVCFLPYFCTCQEIIIEKHIFIFIYFFSALNNLNFEFFNLIKLHGEEFKMQVRLLGK